MQKIKLFCQSEKGKDILIVIIIILLGISSFFLGRLSKENTLKGLKIEYRDQAASALGSISENSPSLDQNPSIETKTSNNKSGNYFASKRGKKYYSTACFAGKTIKQENRIYFSSADEAEKAGFTPSTSC